LTSGNKSLEKAKLSTQAINAGRIQGELPDGSVRICEIYAGFLAERLIVTFNDITERQAFGRDAKEKRSTVPFAGRTHEDTVWLMDMKFENDIHQSIRRKTAGNTLEDSSNYSL